VRADQLQQEFEIDVIWQPYELHPEIPPEGRDRGERRPRPEGYVSPIRQLAEDAGLPFAPGRHMPNSHKSLEAAEFAREQGLFDEYHRALFQAFFGEGRDIGDIAILGELGSSIGLDVTGLEEALTSGRYVSLVNEATEEARGSGITGTPTFIFDDGERRLPIVGAQEYSVFQNVAKRMGATTKSG
jgi:predicted DsbA family dithiol-disulfide isomerase